MERVPAKASTLFSERLFWRQLRFSGNWLHIIFRRIVLEAVQIWREPQQKNQHNHMTVPAQIWRELAPHYFPADCFWGSSDMAETATKKLTTVLYTKYVNNNKNYFPTEPNKLTQDFFPQWVLFGNSNKVLDIFEKQLWLYGCRSIQSKKYDKIILRFNKKLCIKLAFLPQQKNWHNRTTVLYT